MTKKICLFAFSLLSVMLNAQSVPRAFEDWKTAAGTQNFFYKNVTKTDAFGNVVVAGATMANGAPDILVAKYNSSGVQLWIQQFSGLATNGIDFAAGLYVTDTYVYLTGAVTNNTTTPETDCFTMKLSTSTGSIVWNTAYSGSAGYLDGGKFVTVDGSGDVYVTGTTYNSSGNADYLTLKYNGTTGAQTWVNTWGYSAGLDDGAIKCQFSGTDLVVTGAITSTTNNYKVATLKMAQSTGVSSATNIAAAVTTSSVDAVVDLTTDGAGNIIIIGSQYVSGQGNNFYCQKVAGGTLVSAWTYTWNGSSNLDDFGKAVAVDASNNVFIAGSSQSSTLGKELTLIKLNSSGVVQSTATSGFAGDDEAVDMVIDASNNVYLTGYRTNATYHDKNYYTVKYSNACAKTWEIETDGTSYDDNGTNLTLDSLNNVIVTGQSATSSTGDFRFLTTKYTQMDVTNPVDLLAQPTNPNFGYHVNQGQILDETGAPAPNALYYTHHQNPEIYIEKNSYNYVFAAIDTVMATNDSLEKIHVSFAGSSSTVKPYAYDAKTYPLNYFLGHLTQPVTNVVGNDRMVTKDLYPNIDLHYFSNANGLKYYFVVNPGGQVKDIALNIAGANSTTITSNKLVIDGVIGDVTLKRPYAYMVNGAVTTTLTGNSSWVSGGSNTYSITVPSYTTTQTLIIVVETLPAPASPAGTTANCDYSSYYGGNTVDKFLDVKTSSTGGRVVTGYSYGGSFPTFNAFQSAASLTGPFDAIILKYSGGDSLRYATFVGGDGGDYGNSIALTSTGEAIIGGESQSMNLPTTTGIGTSQPSNGFSSSFNFKSDGFLFKLSENGATRLFCRYVGGNKSDIINSVFIDASNNLYFSGTTSSTNFPVINASKSTISSGNAAQSDCMLGKLNTGLTAQWITYFGGGNNSDPSSQTTDNAYDITVDNSGNVYIAGSTDELDFPATNPSPGNPNVLFDNTNNNNSSEGFIARFNSSGTPNYATLVGGDGSDRILRLAYKSNTNELFFAGVVGSTTGFPYKTKSGAYNSSVRRGSSVAFVGYINSSLEHQWVTNYGRGGATKYTGCAGLSVDNTGVVYLSGGTNSDTLIYGATVPTGAYVDNTASGGSDGYIAIFDNNKQIKHAHYWGGSATEVINNSDLYADSRLYVVGNTASNNMPIAYTPATAPLIDSTFNGSDDAFISRFVLYSYNGVGVKETIKNAENSVVLFPNPANNFVTLKILSELEGNVSLKVYNTIGQIIHEETINTTEKTIDCNNWATGMYIFVISNKTINSSFKIIKE